MDYLNFSVFIGMIVTIFGGCYLSYWLCVKRSKDYTDLVVKAANASGRESRLKDSQTNMYNRIFNDLTEHCKNLRLPSGNGLKVQKLGDIEHEGNLTVMLSWELVNVGMTPESRILLWFHVGKSAIQVRLSGFGQMSLIERDEPSYPQSELGFVLLKKYIVDYTNSYYNSIHRTPVV